VKGFNERDPGWKLSSGRWMPTLRRRTDAAKLRIIDKLSEKIYDKK
jgi:hypothetical protein